MLEGTNTKHILGLMNDADGNLWYIANSAMNKYDTKTKKTVTFPTDLFFNATAILKTNDNEIIAASSNELYIYDKVSKIFKGYNLNVQGDPKLPFRINRLFNLNDHIILLGTQNHGVLAYDILEGKILEMLEELKGPIYVLSLIHI